MPVVTGVSRASCAVVAEVSRPWPALGVFGSPFVECPETMRMTVMDDSCPTTATRAITASFPACPLSGLADEKSLVRRMFVCCYSYVELLLPMFVLIPALLFLFCLATPIAINNPLLTNDVGDVLLLIATWA